MHPGKFGLATANGWYITKHGAAVFSSKPFEGEWNQVADTSNLQKSIDSASNTLFTEMPEGQCSVETYTVTHTHKGPDKGIIIGKLTDGTRFLANTERDPDVLEKMCQRDICLLYTSPSPRD